MAETFTMDAQVQTQATAFGICGGKSGTARGFSPNTLVFHYHYHSTNVHLICV